MTLRDNYLTLDDMSYIRSAGLRGFAGLVTEHGGDAEAMARRARLPVQALHDDELLVEDVALARVLELAATELDLPDLGLRLAERQDLAMLGPLAVAIQNSPTLGEALACSARYLFVHARGLSLEAVPDPHGTPGLVALRYGTPAGDVFRQGADVGLGFLHRSIRALHGGGYGLRGVELPHRPLAPVARYEEWFGAPVRVGAAQALLRVPASLMTRPLDDADVTVRTLALEHLGRYANAPGADVTMRVRAVLEESLGTTSTDVGAVAALLAVHPRTLQRRLEAEGTTFARVLDGLRRDRARTYLTTTDMPMTQVAAALGLSEQSALTRCARRWWGRSPREVRSAAAGVVPIP